MNDVVKMERSLKKQLKDFEDRQNGVVVRPKYQPEKPPTGIKIVLCVRHKKHSFLDERYECVVKNTISPLVAKIEATKQAKEAGWKHVAYVIDHQLV